MAKKMIKFTDKNTGTSLEILVGSLGQHVYKLTKSVNEKNDAIRWCNHHDVGEKFDCEQYSLEIISVG